MWAAPASSTVGLVNTATETRAVRARLAEWPGDPDVGHLVLLDHSMRPGDDDVAEWAAESRRRDHRALRTGALFPESRPAFLRAGFRPIDELALLEIDLPELRRRQGTSVLDAARDLVGRGPTQRMTGSDLEEVAALDQRAFPPPWGNDPTSLRAIRDATPSHRSRVIRNDGAIVGFAISGRAGRAGYLQRLAVDPTARRRGLARTLVTDACAWMTRHGATRAVVNTATTNDPAITLYTSLGFHRRAETLMVLELELGPV